MKQLILGLIGLAILAAPNTAKAAAYSDNFDDGILNTNLWEVGNNNDPLDITSLVEQNGRLEWIVKDNDIPYTYNAMNLLFSRWSLALTNDFEFSFVMYAHQIPEQPGGLHFGLVDTTLGHSPVWQGYLSDSQEKEVIEHFSYNAQEDKITILNSGDIHPTQFDGLKAGGINSLGVFLGGWTHGNPVNSGQAYFDNFQIVKGTITPEPISCALFLLGGGALFTQRRFRKKA